MCKKPPVLDGPIARVLKGCSTYTQISPTLAFIFNEPLAQDNIPDDLQQASVSQSLRRKKNMMLQTIDMCL